jgi:class 3 adenylate cyclase
MEATFGFLDLAGFSALTEAHGDDKAADVVERFAELAEGALLGGARVVKTGGDALLITSPHPDIAVRFVQRFLTRIAVEADFPIIRGGFNHGEAVARGTDLFGATVNLAARIASHARGGQILATAAVAAAGRSAGIPVSGLGPFTFKNIRTPVELFALHLMPAAGDEVIDPVCRMRVLRDRAAGRLRYNDTEYWFCSLACAAQFAESPSIYLDHA